MGFTAGVSPVGAIRAMRPRPSTASGLSPYGSMGSLQASLRQLVEDEVSERILWTPSWATAAAPEH
ncbi:hypothetical protein F0U60_06170 [Archangium minus]|uniref:Uncharacterized protein n=1 Tax=Archangium minus TaxID=83450 RepID=A0ABY9WKQ2_9BACT|nr:hypothetical protein F0U60_06170 [Archangium minus]